MNRAFLGYYFWLNLALSGFFLFLYGALWVLNLQVAFITGFAVTLATFHAYAKLVKTDSDTLIREGIEVQETDLLEKYEDPHQLYEEVDENIDANDEEPTKPTLKERAEHLRVSFLSALSPWRVLAYGLLIGGFFFLVGNGWLRIVPYIAGFSIVPIGNLMMGWKLKK